MQMEFAIRNDINAWQKYVCFRSLTTHFNRLIYDTILNLFYMYILCIYAANSARILFIVQNRIQNT